MLHQTGNEVGWWEKTRIEPLPIARHIVGIQSLHHPLTFNRMREQALAAEVEAGIEAIGHPVPDRRQEDDRRRK